jgi:hypothetical protein
MSTSIQPPKAVKTADEIVAMIVERIGYIYERPLMYGGNPESVEALLFALHSLWAISVGRETEYDQVSFQHCKDEGTGSVSFSFHYLRSHPNADVDEQVAYTVANWKVISERAGVRLATPD